MTTTTAHPSTHLSTALRERTRQAHDEAENRDFMHRLTSGELDLGALALLQAQLLPVYEALEDAVWRHGEDPRLRALLDHRLDRAAALRADLDAHERQGLRPLREPLPATVAYVEAIRGCADDPAALVGHHYTRYLGDLSGGQIIARLAARHYDAGPEVLTSYAFDIDRPKVYKDHYRAALDALPLDAEESARALDTAARSFTLSAHQLDELGAAVEPHRAA